MSRPALIRDPRAVPLVGVDDHLAAIPLERLQPQALRERFRGGRDWQPVLPGDGGRLAGREPAAAAVLVGLVERAQGLQVLLTRRTDHLRDHAGQISFPGGRAEADELGDPRRTALRESLEEVGLLARHIEVIGQLPAYVTVTAYVVTPVVALIRPDYELRLDPFEVAEAFEVPLDFLMNPAHHRRHRWAAPDGPERQFLSMPWQATTPQGEAREYFIWGATAAMLRNLYHYLGS